MQILKNKKVIITLLVLVLAIGGFFIIRARRPADAPVEEIEKASLPINDIPVEERPYITLSPDGPGRNLTLMIDRATVLETYEYELVYDAGDKQEGAFGRIDLAKEDQPVEKSLLLGSKSAGGAVTYHEDVSGGSLTLTYDKVKLKESFNFLRFDSAESDYPSIDGRLTVTLSSTALPKNAVIVIMKTFGLPAPVEGTLRAGPYGVFTNTPPKGDVSLAITLSAGDYTDPTIIEWDGEEWVELETILEDDVVSADSVGGLVFAVVSQ